jgi:hypothetical protein
LKVHSSGGINHFDVGYEALWDKSDYNKISKHFNEINQLTKEIKNLTINKFIYPKEHMINFQIEDEINFIKQKKSSLVNIFEDQLERSYNDQTTVIEPHEINKYIIPLKVNKQIDRVVASGMARLAEFSVGESTQFFNHYSAGTGTTPVYASDTALVEELVRVSIEQQGYATASGAVIKFGAYFPPGVQTATITEAGVFDQMVAGVMLFRVVYPLEKSLNHVQSITFFTLSHAIYMSSI